MHNGNIEVHSEKGIGSEFIVSFPYLPAENKAISEMGNEDTEQPANFQVVEEETLEKLGVLDGDKAAILNGSYEILVLDDIDDIRHNIAARLQESFTIYEANNGKDGLKLAFERIPDLVISDIMMPGINGLELVIELKNNEKTSHIPIILLTARDTEQNVIEGIRSGADDYLTKPFSDRSS